MHDELIADFVPIAEVANNFRDVATRAITTGSPVVVTVQRKPRFVIMGVEQYEGTINRLRLARMLAEGVLAEAEADRRSRPIAEAENELLSKTKNKERHHASRRRH